MFLYNIRRRYLYVINIRNFKDVIVDNVMI